MLFTVYCKPFYDFVLVTNYIRKASATPGRDNITVSCSTAESDPRVLCNAVINCDDGTSLTVLLQSGIPQTYKTTQPCKISILVLSASNTNEPLEELTFMNVEPLLPNGEFTAYSIIILYIYQQNVCMRCCSYN